MNTPEDKLVDLMGELERSVREARAGRKHCGVCIHADETGSWVDAPGFDGMTHCRGCHQSWRRASEYQHCTGCHRTFTNVAAADMHRDGGRCLDPATVVGPKSGKAKLQRSTRRMDPRATVELWSHAGETLDRSSWSASKAPEVPQ
jgi:hypothetical protein